MVRIEHTGQASQGLTVPPLSTTEIEEAMNFTTNRGINRSGFEVEM